MEKVKSISLVYASDTSRNFKSCTCVHRQLDLQELLEDVPPLILLMLLLFCLTCGKVQVQVQYGRAKTEQFGNNDAVNRIRLVGGGVGKTCLIPYFTYALAFHHCLLFMVFSVTK